MTKAQEIKLASLTNVLNSYMNICGDLVVETTYGSSAFKRMFIGKRGGFSSASIIYKGYDFEDKKPFGKLFIEY